MAKINHDMLEMNFLVKEIISDQLLILSDTQPFLSFKPIVIIKVIVFVFVVLSILLLAGLISLKKKKSLIILI